MWEQQYLIYLAADPLSVLKYVRSSTSAFWQVIMLARYHDVRDGTNKILPIGLTGSIFKNDILLRHLVNFGIQ